MVYIHVAIGVATLAALTALLWFLWWPLGVGFGVLSAILSEELLIAARAEQAPIRDWEARRKELGY
jgi:hypothetical protein